MKVLGRQAIRKDRRRGVKEEKKHGEDAKEKKKR